MRTFTVTHDEIVSDWSIHVVYGTGGAEVLSNQGVGKHLHDVRGYKKKFDRNGCVQYAGISVICQAWRKKE